MKTIVTKKEVVLEKGELEKMLGLSDNEEILSVDIMKSGKIYVEVRVNNEE